MGRDLMCIESFKDSILRSDSVLQPYGLHLYDLLMNSSESAFTNTLNSFVGIAAIQVMKILVFVKNIVAMH